MIDQPNYYLATNVAYEVLKLYDGGYPQIDIDYMMHAMFNDRIAVHTYSDMASKYGMSVCEFTYNYAESEMGFTVFDKTTGHYEIFYNDKKIKTTIRFTLAHEIGHIILGHKIDNKAANSEANCFARNLLAPLPIRDQYKLKMPNEYSECFNISEYAAQVALEKIENDRYYISEKNYHEIFRDAFIYNTAGYDFYDYFY